MKRKLFCNRYASLFFVLFFIMISQGSALAQPASRTISGVVISADDNQPLIGVGVKIKTTTTGTITDVKGAYHIKAKTGDILEFTYIGFQPLSVTVGEANEVSIKMTPMSNSLDQVIVVGYGTQVKKVVTGATVHVSGSDLAKNHTLTVDQALQGQAPGVQVTSTSGQPGDALKVRIRGIGTIGNSNPLYVVDGFPTYDISSLNPNDIESLDVLKDAASTAIYGTRAANGVILITTKKGKSGKTQVSFDAYYGLQNPAKKLDLLDAHEYGIIMNEAAVNSGKAPMYTLDQLNQLGAGTDWQKAVTQKNAPIENYSVSASGGNDRSTYSSSLSYQKQDGIIGLPGKSNFERISFRINSSHDLYKDIIKFGQNLTYSHSTQSSIGTGNIYGNSIKGLLNTSPTFPVRNPDGTYGISTVSPEEVNPVAAMDYTNNNRTITDRLLGDVFLEATIFKGLKFRSDYGLDLSYNSTNTFIPVYSLGTNNQNTNSTATMGLYRNTRTNWDNSLTYQKSIGKHNLTALLGSTVLRETTFYVSGSKQDLIIPDFNHAIIDNGTNDATQKAFGGITVPEHNILSYFGRINYNYNEKYLLTAIVRRDGSTNFGSNNKYATFPSVSAGWVVTSEEFLKNVKWLDFLKIRAGIGQNGNDNVPTSNYYAYLATVSSTYNSYYFNGVKSTGTVPNKVPNPDLKWETSQQADVGFDATILRDLTVTFDWYNKTTKNWLIVAPVPAIVGTGAPTVNGGDVSNKGIELAVNYQHKFGDLSFGIGGNIAYNKNRVTDIANPEKIIHGATGVLTASTDEFYRAQVGYPIGYFYGLKTDGLFQTQQDVNSYAKNGTLIQPGAKPGDVRFVDLNGDGKIDANDKTMLGDPNPHETYGFNLNAGYKGFDISIQLNGVAGNQIVNGIRTNDRYYANYTTAILGRWTGAGTSNTIPRVTQADEANNNYGRFSDLYIENGDFLRVKTINIGYDFKKGLLKNLPLQQFRLYLSGTNLFTFTKYKGLDPEVGYGNDGWASGTDLGYYPQPRTIMLGLSVKF
ncbi:TonB-dependent receptor [Mucilaginibacter sp. SG564]|uniref:SusC/RagA family TonB-linked outer membrane protein n=1 Tax=Mucilaginibacter sp. SG564 TaxID=2587022 RepID=UPI001551A3C6|nr:TonB-dependent receptor [Mucilaginibacter sp. SG564]NOW97905.1 TonB-linked SusC/RagA family outer membrane protein [Mucilaginibacter sp. SG564]